MGSNHSETQGHSEARGSLHRLDLRLPPLPHTLPRVLERLHAPGTLSVEEVTDVVREDPAVLSRILKHVNSSYYGLRRSVTDVERAVCMMGPRAAAGTVVGLSVLGIDDLMDGPAGPCVRSLLRHSEATAVVARYLLNQNAPRRRQNAPTEPTSPGDAGFTEGFLHDFGKLILIYNYPDTALALYQNDAFQEDLAAPAPHVLEQRAFGCNHMEAGGYAASEMNFPQGLVDVIRHHHDLDGAHGQTDTPGTLKAVRTANRSTRAMGPAFAGVHPTDPDPDRDPPAPPSAQAGVPGTDGTAKRSMPLLGDHTDT